ESFMRSTSEKGRGPAGYHDQGGTSAHERGWRTSMPAPTPTRAALGLPEKRATTMVSTSSLHFEALPPSGISIASRQTRLALQRTRALIADTSGFRAGALPRTRTHDPIVCTTAR